MKKIDRTGEERINTFGSLMIIKEYRNNRDVDVYFPEYGWTKEHVWYNHFKVGNVKCPYERRFYNKGYLGEGKSNALINRQTTKHFNVWHSMLERCYSSKYIEKYPTYKDCIVCDEWLNFQAFSEWFDENYYEIEGERTDLDKDILCKGNKIYSPKNCVFVPQSINLLFVKRDKCRGELPIGVSYKYKKYVAYCNTNGKKNHLGSYDTKEEAFEVYKNFKENYIKEVAEEYKDKIPTKLYNRMIKYQIEIND